MSVRKAFLQFLKLFVIFLLVGTLGGIIKYFLKYQEVTAPIIDVFTTIISYFLFFKYILKQETDIQVKASFRLISDNLIFPIILIAIGLEFFEKPLFDMYDKIFVPKEFLNIFKHTKNVELNISLIFSLISSLVVAPIFEEIIFRKYLLGNLLKENSVQKAILFSSICFSLFHFPNFRNLLPTFIFGVIAGYIYVKTKNITYTLVFHFVVNLIVSLIRFYGATLIENLTHLHFNIFYWLITTFGGIILIYFGIKFFNKNLGKVEIESSN